MNTDKKTPTEAQVTANRKNAEKSTGPRTEEGKAKSRMNALKHGLCAQVIDVPDEDPGLLEARFEAWRAELNPDGSHSGDYLVLIAARKSIKLDRCHVVGNAAVAELARDAGRADLEARAMVVDDLVRMLPTDPDVASRRLKQTAEGCAALLHGWATLAKPLIAPAAWDAEDEQRALRLLGMYTAVKATGPSPLYRPTLAIAEHRQVAEKLRLNECPSRLYYSQKYSDADDRQYDVDRVDYLADRAALAVAHIQNIMETEVALLESTRARLVEESAPGRAEATFRARFDASDSGKLMHRYEMDAERGLYRALGELREMRKSGVGRPQVQFGQSDTTGMGFATSARNEADPGARGRSPDEALWAEMGLESPNSMTRRSTDRR